jgi:hypothetical protein
MSSPVTHTLTSTFAATDVCHFNFLYQLSCSNYNQRKDATEDNCSKCSFSEWLCSSCENRMMDQRDMDKEREQKEAHEAWFQEMMIEDQKLAEEQLNG